MKAGIEKLLEAYQGTYGVKDEIWLFLDEIPRLEGWERWIRKWYDL